VNMFSPDGTPTLVPSDITPIIEAIKDESLEHNPVLSALVALTPIPDYAYINDLPHHHRPAPPSPTTVKYDTLKYFDVLGAPPLLFSSDTSCIASQSAQPSVLTLSPTNQYHSSITPNGSGGPSVALNTSPSPQTKYCSPDMGMRRCFLEPRSPGTRESRYFLAIPRIVLFVTSAI
jgi:hypothetical protein